MQDLKNLIIFKFFYSNCSCLMKKKNIYFTKLKSWSACDSLGPSLLTKGMHGKMGGQHGRHRPGFQSAMSRRRMRKSNHWQPIYALILIKYRRISQRKYSYKIILHILEPKNISFKKHLIHFDHNRISILKPFNQFHKLFKF